MKYKLATVTLTDEDFECHFDISEFQQVIAFIENELIPELANEEGDLLEKYGGREGFYQKFDEDKGFIEAEIYDEYYDSDPGDMTGVLDAFKNLLSNAMDTGKAYERDIY